MHNISNHFFQVESEDSNNREYGYEMSPEFELENEYGQEYSGETQYELSPEFEFEHPQYENTSYAELAQELNNISNKEQLKHIVKKTAKKAVGVTEDLLNSPKGQKATAALTSIGEKALPKIASAAGKFVARKLDNRLDKPTQPGTSRQQDQDRAIDFIRFVADVFQDLSKGINSGQDHSVKESIIQAASRHFPAILKGNNGASNIKAGTEHDNESGFYNEYLNEGEAGEYGYETSNGEGSFNEYTQMELASELLSVYNETELDRFLGNLFKKATGDGSETHKSPLGGILKGIAKKALPIAGGILGSVIPGAGTAIGSALGSAASNLFELELEGLSAEDREFEVAKAFVRFAGNAARRASRMRHRPPHHAARLAVINAARQDAPGLIVQKAADDSTDTNNDPASDKSDPATGGPTNSEIGYWRREGNQIIIQGAFKKRSK